MVLHGAIDSNGITTINNNELQNDNRTTRPKCTKVYLFSECYKCHTGGRSIGAGSQNNSGHNSEITVMTVTGPLKAETTGRWYAVEKKQREKY